MADMFQFGYGDPSNFSDFAKYAGLDRKTGMATPYDLGSDQGVAPPANMQELLQQKVADPFNKKVEGFKQQGTNISNAVNQFEQGNFVQGVNAARVLCLALKLNKQLQPRKVFGDWLVISDWSNTWHKN
jgi:hypothetical protein